MALNIHKFFVPLSRWLRRVPMILFINKIDVLAEKVNSGHTLDQFVQTVSPNNPFYKYFQPFREYFKSDCVKGLEIEFSFMIAPFNIAFQTFEGSIASFCLGLAYIGALCLREIGHTHLLWKHYLPTSTVSGGKYVKMINSQIFILWNVPCCPFDFILPKNHVF